MNEETIYRRRWATLGVLCISLLVISLDNTILNVALPSLSNDLDATASQLQWMVDSYTLVFAGLVLTAGSIGDRFGRRSSLIAGLVVFGLSSIWAAWASSPTELITARAVMGIGGAFIMPATLSVLTNVFQDAAERAKAIGIWAAVSAVGIVFGPAAGGWLLEHFWWGSVFLVNVPVTIVGVIAAFFLVPNSADPSKPRLDPAGAILSTSGLMALVWAIIEAPARGWTAAPTLTGLAIGAILLVAFAIWELRAPEPMLDLRFFSDARFSAASLSVTLAFFALFGATFFLTQYLQFVLGYDALETGIRIMPIATIVFGAPLSMAVTARFGAKIPVTVGMVLVTAAMLVMSTCTETTGYGRVAVVLILIGLGLGMTLAPATDAIMTSLPPEKAGVGSALNDANRLVGGALGVAVLGSVLSSVFSRNLESKIGAGSVPEGATEGVSQALNAAALLPGRAGQALHDASLGAFVDGMETTLLVAAAFSLAGALVSLFWLPSWPKDTTPTATEDGDDLDAELDDLAATELAVK